MPLKKVIYIKILFFFWIRTFWRYS